MWLGLYGTIKNSRNKMINECPKYLTIVPSLAPIPNLRKAVVPYSSNPKDVKKIFNAKI